ncbi:disease resistance protein RPV1-like isoform X2 [Cornus florida]|uniref:disease resistance protein RPV1-like isoform X2 n=1 Tax=Cornus florida TaxID=4283 RepID=UPI002897404D|nr:disease resistance protein RPV1-like isoform X2 [Cornus florida]
MASTSTHIHIASSSPTPTIHEVFLSFRGEDTRKNFVDHLYRAFFLNGIYTFKDDKELKSGEEISPALLKAIKESRIALIIFSKNYASSRWCLDELVKILECKETMGQTVIPVFYDVVPSEVRYQIGSFESAFKIHEKGRNKDKVQRWKTALTQAANLSGHSVPDIASGHESECIQKIIGDIFSKLNRSSPIVGDDDDLIGIESHVKEVESLLRMELNDVRSVGIWGMGGIGKSTIAKAVYDRISHQFQGSCFLRNVRENSESSKDLEALQEKLHSQILNGSTFVGLAADAIRYRLRCRRVLVVLDDVDQVQQLEALARKHWFGSGSRIIITTRDEQLLISHGVTQLYEAKALKFNEAIQLFSSKAFFQSSPHEDYKVLSEDIVHYTGGLPLALRILGSSLCGKTVEEWTSALSQLHTISDENILKVLKISYDGLTKLEKKIFLDIACFFKGKQKDFVTRILDGCCGFKPDYGIRVLIQKSLLTMSDDHFSMHDLVQEMGWYIVREESPEPGERSRLWVRKEVCNVLAENSGTKKVKAIVLELVEAEDVGLSTEAFTKMTNLRLLILQNVLFSDGSRGSAAHLSNQLKWLDWHAYPSNYLPASFRAENLVELKMCYSRIVRLWKEIKPLPNLKVINLSHSHRLSSSPDFTVVPKLETLILEDCTSLVEVHPSLGGLKRLVFLNLRGCTNLKKFPSSIHLEYLETLNLSGCWRLENFPEILGDMVHLSELYLDRTAIKELPSSIERLTSLILMDLRECKNLSLLPETICRLSCLKNLELTGCSTLEELPEDIGNLKCLEELHADKTGIKRLPSSINLLKELKDLSLSGCKGTMSTQSSSLFFLARKREHFPGLVLPSVAGLYSLRELNLNDCNLSVIPSDIGSLSSLKELYLNRNNFESLPSSISQLPDLEMFELVGCKRLKALPELPFSRYFQADDCQSLISIGDLSRMDKVSFTNCTKLLENKESENEVDMLLRIVLQNICYWNFCPRMLLPGREIPEWFTHQYEATNASVQLPPDWFNDETFLGVAVCVAFDSATAMRSISARAIMGHQTTFFLIPEANLRFAITKRIRW